MSWGENEMIKLLKYTLVLSMLTTLFCVSGSTWANLVNVDLVAAAANGNLSRVRTLLAAKADVNTKADNGMTALIAASQNGYEEIVQVLLEASADVNAKTSNGTTALMQASQKGHEQVVQKLLAAKAVDWIDRLASAIGAPETGERKMELVIEAGFDGPLHQCRRRGDADGVTVGGGELETIEFHAAAERDSGDDGEEAQWNHGWRKPVRCVASMGVRSASVAANTGRRSAMPALRVAR